MKMGSMTICNLYHADGATPVGNMSKLIQLKLNSSQAQIESTPSDLIKIPKRGELAKALIELMDSTQTKVGSKLHMAVSSILPSKLQNPSYLFHEELIII